jgi:very-short-patch-repair endonuclease
MRQNQTPAESKLWTALRKQQVAGLKFRRQHAIDGYIVDFYCHEMRLVIEVDGPTHAATVEEDAIRQEAIQSQGITVLRFKNDEIFDDLPSVLERIMITAGVSSAATSPSPPLDRTAAKLFLPLPVGRGGGRGVGFSHEP